MVDIEKEKQKYPCEICGGIVDMIVCYSKYYPIYKKSTLEYPCLLCKECYEKIKNNEVNNLPQCFWETRGGVENVRIIRIKELVGMSEKEIAYAYLNRKNYIKNHLFQIRKVIFRLRYLNLPKKTIQGGDKDVSKTSSSGNIQ